MIKKIGFTLAEVLITLVIIGVIAAITIPTVMQNTQRQENLAKFKKAHSTLAQSVIKISTTEGYPVGDFSFLKNDEFFVKFANELNTIRICKDKADGCFVSQPYQLGGQKWPDSYYNAKNSLYTADGIAYSWHTFCGGNKGVTKEDEKNCIGRFIVDINGERKPNRFGYDIFFFLVVNNKGIVPAGAGNGSADCKHGGNGITCAAKVLQENKFSYL